jgi:hypothetical protein
LTSIWYNYFRKPSKGGRKMQLKVQNDNLEFLISEYVKIRRELKQLEFKEKQLRQEILNKIKNENIVKGINNEIIAIQKKIMPIYDPKILFELIDKEKFFQIVSILNTKANKLVDEVILNKALKDIKEVTYIQIIS